MGGVQTERPRAEPAPTQAPHPPANLEAEEYVLGALMLAGAPIDAIRTILQPSHFWRESHARIYRAALDLHDIGSPIDVLLLTDELQQRGELHHLEGGKDRIRELATLVPAATNAPFHAQKIVDAHRLRQIIITGEAIARLAWDREGSTDQVTARALELASALNDTGMPALDVETWHRFESQAHDEIPTLVDGLWAEGALGFIAAGPKKGKTWLALALAVAVATGKPFLDQNTPNAHPVLYVALEGHRAAIRARVGAIARGMNIDPDGDQLRNLHFLYKPRGINLADPTWANRLHQAAKKLKAKLAIIDVLRASARIRENQQEDFTALAHNLAPITTDGCSLAILHHFTKLSEISKERTPGERMSGTGSMFGALDVGIYITGSQNQARELRLEFDTRDIAGPETLSLLLEGEGTGPNGGFTYRDTATWTIVEDEVAEDDFKKATPQEIHDYIADNGGDVTATEIRAYFDISSDTLTRRLHRLELLGIQYRQSRGRHPARLVLTTSDEPRDTQLDVLDPTSATSAQPQPTRAEVDAKAEVGSLNQAVYASTSATSAQEPCGGSENGVSRGKATSATSASLRDVRARARASAQPAAPARRLAEQEDWADHQGWMEDEPYQATATAFPNLGPHDLKTIAARCTAKAAREAGTVTP